MTARRLGPLAGSLQGTHTDGRRSFLKTLLPMIFCRALLPAPLALAQENEAVLQSCIGLAKSIDDDLKEHPGKDIGWLHDFFEIECLKRYGCPDFETIRKMEMQMAMKPSAGHRISLKS